MLVLLIIYGFAITYENIAFAALLPLICYQSFTILAPLQHTQWSTRGLPRYFYTVCRSSSEYISGE